MKTHFIYFLILIIVCSSCGATQMASDNSHAVLTGVAIGGNIGSAIGGLIGENNGGWRGEHRGSAIGTIIGTIAGATIANATTSRPKKEEQKDQLVKENNYLTNSYNSFSALDGLRIHNIRFIDDDRNHTINSGENSKVVFEIINESEQTACNIVPVVTETTGMKRIYISPSVEIKQISPNDGVQYTVNIEAGERIKTGKITIRIAITDENDNTYDQREFSLPTQR